MAEKPLRADAERADANGERARFIRDTLRIRFDRLLPLWNYVVLPAPDATYWEVI